MTDTCVYFDEYKHVGCQIKASGTLKKSDTFVNLKWAVIIFRYIKAVNWSLLRLKNISGSGIFVKAPLFYFEICCFSYLNCLFVKKQMLNVLL